MKKGKNLPKKSTVIVILLIVIVCFGVAGTAISKLHAQRKKELRAQERQLMTLIRVFDLQDEEGAVGVTLNIKITENDHDSNSFFTVKQYGHLLPTDLEFSNTQERIDNLNAFARQENIYDGDTVLQFTMDEVLHNPFAAYDKVQIYQDYLDHIFVDVNIYAIAHDKNNWTRWIRK